MKIKDIKVLICKPGRNFVTVKIITESGVYGVGDATLNGRELAVASYIEEHIKPCLIGKSALNIEDIWQYLYKGAYWRKGPVTMTAIGAIDMALWDIFGKHANVPVHQLLGGKSRNGITVYAHANGESIEEVLTNLGNFIEQGYKAVRLQCSIPKSKGTYGTLEGKKNYYELQGNRPLPPENEWSTRKYMNFIPELFKQARERFGFDVDLLHDVHSRLTPIEAARLCKLLEPYDLLFVEDPVIAENQSSYAQIRTHTTTPLAVGETFNTIWDCKELIETQSIDYIRTAVSHGGGITPLRRVADFASLYHVRLAPHGAPDLSPIAMMAHMSVNAWAPNFGIQEFIGFGTDEINEVFKYEITLQDGMILPNEKPGLGVDIDEAAMEKYPYKRSYLPVSRLEDGTIWNW
ncbi:bifunctional D-altronate/D-mannonate dehydratase [Vibrio sp. UCD-FRSSP16_10]|uniref:D-mannonate dehydratase ManD n=1 Tax=unclassified Vibrio TaxID=2614977 RepID=UPI0008005C7B|nr:MULTISPECIES: D-mannonate dehydratase ManD [unclassified Vibrio]OBT06658.1 bifunctional D-altronate/D-mannonate dehydratase [Vibrio sp. UCD-FRSSP16_30]OBT12355.1 bifunctional D-altronate/D-mannonate dehydratase [Vibrio sp. UCD-FRSSP16_10]